MFMPLILIGYILKVFLLSLLSVLIPTVVGREAQFNALIETIPVPILYCKDNKEMSIGTKRQLLLDKCETEYFVMCDDDDALSLDYFPTILPLLEKKPDCICYLEDINGVQTACHSNRFEDWGIGKGYHYYRTPFYKDVLRTDIARKIGFNDLRYGEDYDFAKRLKTSRLIQNEIFVDKKMYFYKMPNALSNVEHKKRYGIR
jgi:hypothetical protein